MGFREKCLYRKHLYILTQKEEKGERERERWREREREIHIWLLKKGKGEQERNVRMKQYSLVKEVPC